jgi:uncharacterized Tic20 family protein
MTTPTVPPLPVAQNNDKLWIILCHLSSIIGFPFIIPLVIYLAKRQESALIAAHAAEVLNFHISLVIYVLCAVPLVFLIIGIPIILGLYVMAFVCAIIAAIKASEGGFYCYPLTIRLIS